MKVYFAGPDVFYPDYADRKEAWKKKCREAGIAPIFPGDGGLLPFYTASVSQLVFHNNIECIRVADAVIANLNPFRGQIEPDSGTVLECGYAYALGKTVVGVVADRRSQIEKLQFVSFTNEKKVVCFSDGSEIENYGLPLNLMVFQAIEKLVGSMDDACDYLAGKTRERDIQPIAQRKKCAN
jgi:nucleoside 2-deoxyribosyltransferase